MQGDLGAQVENPKGRIMTRGHGFPLDHVALAVSDTEAGVAHVEALTGVRPTLTQRDKKDFYWSAALEIGEDSFLEVIGPNPDHRGIHPLKSFMAGVKEPTLLFWYIATDNFEACKTRIEAAGEKLKMIVRVDPDASANGADYTRAAIGSGFVTQKPGLIEWRRRSLEPAGKPLCRLTGFSLSHPSPDPLNRLFDHLGMDLVVEQGPSLIGLTLDTPNGAIRMENPGTELSLLGMLLALLRHPFG